MHRFPLIEALWASLDQERPSGDDPKRVALALSRFYRDLRNHIEQTRTVRWRTPLFQKLDPDIRATLEELVSLSEALAASLPGAEKATVDRLRELDRTLRQNSFALEEEEKGWALPQHASPKLNQFQYLYEGWKRGYLPAQPLERFGKEYLRSVEATLQEIALAEGRVGPRESEEEKVAVQKARGTVEELQQALTLLLRRLPEGAAACQPLAQRLIRAGQELGQVFQTLERCSPLEDPCPFCGGQLSLSGRCRRCGRRLPHLEEGRPGEQEVRSEFLSLNCRALDIALLKWEREPENLKLWQEFQAAVREFSEHVNKGRQALEMLAAAADRPVDSASERARQEATLREVGHAFQDALTHLSRFSRSSSPPPQPLPPDWREPLKEAELKLKALEEAAKPDDV